MEALDLQIHVEQSVDDVRWQSRSKTAEINPSTLTTTAETKDTNPPSPQLAYVRFAVKVTGTPPSAEVICAIGRDGPKG